MFRHLHGIALAAFLILAGALSGPGGESWAQTSAKTEVDVELILMADVSGSVDDQDFILQREGYAQALRNPRVLAAIRSGQHQRIALSFVEWSGPDLHFPIVPWQLIAGAEDLEGVARDLETIPRAIRGGGTAVGNAIVYAVRSIEDNGFAGTRRVIDISGDGPDNRDNLPASAGRDQAVSRGITVNGLPILDPRRPDLEFFFLDDVIGGPGAFSVPARGFKDVASAVLAKLIREIAGTSGQPGENRAEAPASPASQARR